MKKTVITIARSYGSGGRTLGKLLAEELGINCYDREILRMASDDSGINEALFGQTDEKLKKSPLFRIARKNPYKGGVIPPESADFVSDDNLFNYQAKVIRELAEEESCIIIGRCADYVLKDDPNVLRLFFFAPKEDCIVRVMEHDGITRRDAENKIEKIDKLLDLAYTTSNILIPVLDYALEHEHITDREHAILQAVVKDKAMCIKSGDLEAIIGKESAVQRSRIIRRLKEKNMLVPLKDSGRIYTIGFANNYLLRGVIHTLRQNGFVPDSLNEN